MTDEQAGAAELMRDSLNQIANWLVCSAMTTNDDMAKSFPSMLEVAESAVQAWDRAKEKT